MIDKYRLYKGSWIFKIDAHKEELLTKQSIDTMLARGGLIVRNTYNFDCLNETSFWYVIKDKFGEFEELSVNTRSKIRRCFKLMYVQRISPELLIESGYPVYVQAAESYKIKAIPPTFEDFKKRVIGAEENEYWGVFEITTGKLVAFSMNYVTDESCEYKTLKALPEYMKKYAYYGLIYEMNRFYLGECKLKYVNDGARTITEHSNIQPFLIGKFNFRKAYCNLNLHYKCWFGLIVKILYPFRKIILNRKVKSILNMEAMARGEY